MAWLPVAPPEIRDAIIVAVTELERLGMVKATFATRSEAGRYAANMRWKGHVKAGGGRKEFAYKKVEGFGAGAPIVPEPSVLNGKDLLDAGAQRLLGIPLSQPYFLDDAADLAFQKTKIYLAAVLDANMTTAEIVYASAALNDAGLGYFPSSDSTSRKIANLFIQSWAGSSNNGNIPSLLTQNVVEREFGLTDATTSYQLKGVEFGTEATVQKLLNDSPQLDRAVTLMVHAQYDATQAFLKANGMESVILYRGVRSKTLYADVSDGGTKLNAGQERNLRSRPISSWSASRDAATRFADYGFKGESVVLRRTVPASQIFSTPLTGYGSLGEFEMVVLGGTHQTVVQAYAPAGTYIADKG